MFTVVSNTINDILIAIIPTTTLKSVYNYDLKSYTTFPCATISVIDWEETFLDTATNQDDLNIRIRVADKNTSVETMESRMRLLADEILEALRKNINLNNTVCKVTYSITWGWADEQHPIRIFEITCHCTVTNSIF